MKSLLFAKKQKKEGKWYKLQSRAYTKSSKNVDLAVNDPWLKKEITMKF
jgi:hypothetical protein